MPEPQSAAALRACAAGLYHAEAACELLIATSWPHRADFRDRFIHAAVSIRDGTTAMANFYARQLREFLDSAPQRAM